MLAAAPAAWGTVSGRNGPMAFVRYLTCPSNPSLSGPQIYRLAADGTGLKNLSQSVCSGDSDRFPVWSPDGSKIAFDRQGPHGFEHIWVMNADGTGQTQLTRGTSYEYGYITWSPTGNQIAFSPESGSIWIMNANGSDPTQVPNTSQADNLWRIAWSPDGSRIAFSADITGNEVDLYTITTSGTDLTDLTPGSGYDWEGADWSPSGRQLLTTRCAQHAGCDDSGVWTVNADGSGQAALTSAGTSAFDGGPVWAPNGVKIAFGGPSGGTFGIVTMNGHGSNQSLFAAGSEPSWGVPFR
jgi:Tol biopolymer transport system component